MNPRAFHDKANRFREAIEAGSYDGLPEKEQAECAQVHTVMSLLLEPLKTSFDIVKLLDQEHGLKVATAFRRIELAKEVLGDLTKSNRAVEMQIAYRRAEDNYLAAVAIRDRTQVDDETKLMAIDRVNKAIELMGKIKGFDRNDDGAIDPNKFPMADVRLVLTGDSGRTVRALARMGRVDFDVLLKDVPEAEYATQPQLPATNGAAAAPQV